MNRSTSHRAPHQHEFHSPTRRRAGMSAMAVLAMIASGGAATAALFVSATTMSIEATPGAKDAIEAKEARAKKLESTSAHKALVIAGLTPANLAAAGLDAGDVTALISVAQGYLVGGGIQMAGALADQADAASRVARLEDRVVSGRSHEGDTQDLASARADLAAADSAREIAVSSFYASVTAGFTPEQRDALANIRAQQPSTVAPEYLVHQWDEAERIALRDALAAQRIAERSGDVGFVAPPALSQADDIGDIANAVSHVQNNLPAIKAVWENAFGRH